MRTCAIIHPVHLELETAEIIDFNLSAGAYLVEIIKCLKYFLDGHSCIFTEKFAPLRIR